MSPKLRDQLAALPERQLNLIAGGIVAILLVLAWSVALRGPLAAHRNASAALAVLEAASANNAPAASTAVLPGAPAAAPPPVAPEPLVLIGAVSRSASLAGVNVLSAAQGGQHALAGVRLRTIDIVASGSYAAIVGWLAAIEEEQPAVGIAGLALEAGEQDDTRTITLQLVIYDTATPP